jgi:hypothetical protein
MRMLSDLSGSRITEGFDDYLTGYFLPDGEYFCFAKTWYAYERRRPGCVWTHSLLISNTDIKSLDDLARLLPYFQRPYVENYSVYNSEIVLSNHSDHYSYIPPQFAPGLIKLIYSDNLPVVMPFSETKSLEEIHLALWRLVNITTRIPYQFCTGSIQLRNAAVRQFDVQTVPKDSLREITRSNRSIHVFGEFNGSEYADWVRLLLLELQGQKTALIPFLQEYCRPSNRKDVGAYARVFIQLSEEKYDYKAVLEIIATEFPDPNDAINLKVAVAGSLSARKLSSEIPEADVLQAVLQSNVPNAFSSDALGIVDRFTHLWTSNERSARAVAKTALDTNSDNSDKLCDRLFEILSPTSFGLLLSREQDIALALVYRKPQLAFQRDIWTSNPQIAKQVAAFVCESKAFSETDLSQIIDAQIEALTPNVASTMVEFYPVLAAESLIKWLYQHQDRTAPNEWKGFIENNPELTSWMRQSINNCEFANLVIRLISPSSELARSVKTNKWISTSHKCSVDNKELSGLHTMLCCLAFQYTNDEGEALLIEAFPKVYSQIEQGSLRDTLWNILADYLPPAGWWWDKCKRMRAGLLKKCAYGEVSRETFVSCMSNGQILIDIITMWGWDLQEQKYIGNVLRDIASHNLKASKELVDISQKYVDWFTP